MIPTNVTCFANILSRQTSFNKELSYLPRFSLVSQQSTINAVNIWTLTTALVRDEWRHATQHWNMDTYDSACERWVETRDTTLEYGHLRQRLWEMSGDTWHTLEYGHLRQRLWEMSGDTRHNTGIWTLTTALVRDEWRHATQHWNMDTYDSACERWVETRDTTLEYGHLRQRLWEMSGDTRHNTGIWTLTAALVRDEWRHVTQHWNMDTYGSACERWVETRDTHWNMDTYDSAYERRVETRDTTLEYGHLRQRLWETSGDTWHNTGIWTLTTALVRDEWRHATQHWNMDTYGSACEWRVETRDTTLEYGHLRQRLWVTSGDTWHNTGIWTLTAALVNDEWRHVTQHWNMDTYGSTCERRVETRDTTLEYGHLRQRLWLTSGDTWHNTGIWTLTAALVSDEWRHVTQHWNMDTYGSACDWRVEIRDTTLEYGHLRQRLWMTSGDTWHNTGIWTLTAALVRDEWRHATQHWNMDTYGSACERRVETRDTTLEYGHLRQRLWEASGDTWHTLEYGHLRQRLWVTSGDTWHNTGIWTLTAALVRDEWRHVTQHWNMDTYGSACERRVETRDTTLEYGHLRQRLWETSGDTWHNTGISAESPLLMRPSSRLKANQIKHLKFKSIFNFIINQWWCVGKASNIKFQCKPMCVTHKWD